MKGIERSCREACPGYTSGASRVRFLNSQVEWYGSSTVAVGVDVRRRSGGQQHGAEFPLPGYLLNCYKMVLVSPLPLAGDANNCAKMRLLGYYGRQFIRLCTLPPATISFVFALLFY